MSFFDKLFDIFKLKSTNELESSNTLPVSPQSDYQQTIYFKNGNLYKIVPKHSENWYDARYLFSDGVLYDLENIDDIKSIPIPKFNQDEANLSEYGVTGSLDYVLRMKAKAFMDRNEKDLCSVCLWKATELMPSSGWGWSKKDYDRLIKWHIRLGMLEQAEKAKDYLSQRGFIYTDIEIDAIKTLPNNEIPTAKSPIKKTAKSNRLREFTPIEKEFAIAERVTIDDMIQLTNLPFLWNAEIQKYLDGHPFAYMDIVGDNLTIVEQEIQKMNAQIKLDLNRYKELPQSLRIPFEKLFFTKIGYYSYTRLICTPKTFTGKPSKYPINLYFTTDETKIGISSSHGNIYYGQNGKIEKAEIHFWKNHNRTSLIYKTINGVLTLTTIEQSDNQ